MSSNGNTYKSAASFEQEIAPLEGDDDDSDLANQALAGLIEPTEEIIAAIADCKARYGSIKINMGSMNLVRFFAFDSGAAGVRYLEYCICLPSRLLSPPRLLISPHVLLRRLSYPLR